MGFKMPEYLKNYINNAKYRKPFENFVNNSTYYSQLNWQWISYMESVVRPCLSYATASTDGVFGSSLSTATGMAIVKGATRLIAGDKLFFDGNDDDLCWAFSASNAIKYWQETKSSQGVEIPAGTPLGNPTENYSSDITQTFVDN